MRLAEFRIKLLVYFAGKLLRWAGAPEREPEWFSERAANSNAATPATRALDSSNRTPPEHWLRLTKTAPPEPWLELIREKAPNLLSSLEVEISIQSELDTGSEINQQDETASLVAPGESETANEEIASQTMRVNPMNFSVSTRTSWLNRLRFVAPRRRVVKEKATYVPYEPGKQNSSGYVVPNQSDRQPPVLSFAGESRTVIEPESVPTATHSEERQSEPAPTAAESQPVRTSVAQYFTTHRSRSEDTLRIFQRRPRTKKRSSPAWITKEGTFSKAVRAFRSLRYFDDGSRQWRENNASENTGDQAQNQQHFSIAEELEVATSEYSSKSRPTYSDLDLGRFQHPQPQVTRLNFAAPVTRTGASATNYPATDARRSVDELQFSQPEFSSPDVSNEPSYYQRANVWPELPQSPVVELSDELLRIEGETDELRRLDEEQRGTPCWHV